MASGITTLLESRGFVVALLVATAGVLVAVAGRLVAPRASKLSTETLLLSLGAVVAGVAGLVAEDALPRALPLGIAFVAVGARVAASRPLALRVAAMVPGAALVTIVAGRAAPGWAQAAGFVVVLGAGPAAAAFDRRVPQLTFGLLAVSALGVYATVPDTEEARALVGALVPLALAGAARRYRPESSGPAAMSALLVWVALVGGRGRPGAVVGALGCLGVLVLVPLVWPRWPMVRIRREAVLPLGILAAVHVAVVAIASRVAGLRSSGWVAVAVVVPSALGAATLLLPVRPPRRASP